jgi:hypothetical protein
MLAAIWLAQGYDSEELRGLAGLTLQEAREGGRRLLAGVLSSLGWPMRDWWNAPYAAAQEVIDVASDVPDLWIPAGGERFVLLLRDCDTSGRAPAD